MNRRKEIVPNNLKEYRVKAGLTQKEVSALLGFTNEVSLCNWEQGKNVVGLVNLLKLYKIYKTTVVKLYSTLWLDLEKNSLLKRIN